MILEGVSLERAGGRGVCIAHAPDGKTLLVSGGAPGDVVTVKVLRKKKKHLEGIIERIEIPSPHRVEPTCAYAAHCGGCSWQHVAYEEQARFKEIEVRENLRRIGDISCDDFRPIILAPAALRYRNKLEFSFSSSRWLSWEEIASEAVIAQKNALGFHVPGMWDKIMDIDTCHLQPEPSNAIKNFVRQYALDHALTFFHPREKHGMLRTMMVRCTQAGQWMLVMQFYEAPGKEGLALLQAVVDTFPEITSLYYAHNPKPNDSIYDVDLVLFAGETHLTEHMPSALAGGKALSFKIGPKSFYQTNPAQAHRLYSEVLALAGLKGGETVYDLYTGTGTIALFMAQVAGKVVGVESVPEAIAAAKENAIANGLNNTVFEVGDMRQAFSEVLWDAHGKPDVLVTDPPRDGMHPKVVAQLLTLDIPKIVYVSCNSASQARDLALLKEAYDIVTIQPVDMFPQTHHVENIALLSRKNG
ncbi:MAG TPA: 23S rRNA (uracil(1939)-C(5))-methyltransferase RlmD [Cryomorphaceae bacterium]|jgi:23S rRNA (uracil1939-C5)-methyltransferase|nr:MAG: RNA methyltransferase [Cryomorphaceae bacterium BACL7 MAG-120910-bin2]KRO68266.1 MAG: RNA methyltransferase [Cryomorphaceae bacterium BACL7 MAG-120322-bin74]KRO83670.1 MAG: RNA methyltransferase [Cryomorphaceae bacterium BACL7 MAG-121220-bin83]NQW26109.1 23S rRNA (uracil(1939)-C(5))-methyltransferase RlmD [Cryomorphaceae bacterium]HAB32186.1 23S rRNA (uracil(1939)-C(5))-methyltransferase RlmD [Cryomorphaceae bacterium]